ncbi:hypothetical protein [Haloferax sp. Atlit-48N]|uniref:Uncharacterized protein n=1 Tax=Haloferax sp. Atlit-48N TaxID=2077198 RepID=A0ACD5I5S5_9EURY|nr:hypothetical protein [Haloferax sp. Atlit-48N]
MSRRESAIQLPGLDVEEEASENETRERRYKWSQMSLDELASVVHCVSIHNNRVPYLV